MKENEILYHCVKCHIPICSSILLNRNQCPNCFYYYGVVPLEKRGMKYYEIEKLEEATWVTCIKYGITEKEMWYNAKI